MYVRKRLRGNAAEADESAPRTLLALPAGVTVPCFFTEETDPQMLSDALQIGASTVAQAGACLSSMLTGRLLSDERRKMEEAMKTRYASDLDRCNAASAHTLEMLRLDVARAEHVRATLEADVRDGARRVADLRENFDEEMARRVSEVREQHMQEKRYMEEQLNAMRAALEGQRQEREWAREQLRARDVGAANSSLKGAAGEESMEQLIRRAFSMTSNFSIINESHVPGRGDRLTTIMGLKVMWEIKSHCAVRDTALLNSSKRKVETKEVKKLLENATANEAEYDVCVMVALHANITGHDAHPVQVKYHGRVCIIYVNELLAKEDPVYVLQWHVGNILIAHLQLKQYRDMQCVGADGFRQESTAAAAAATVGTQVTVFLDDVGKQSVERRKMLARHKKSMDAMHAELLEEHRQWEITTTAKLRHMITQLLPTTAAAAKAATASATATTTTAATATATASATAAAAAAAAAPAPAILAETLDFACS